MAVEITHFLVQTDGTTTGIVGTVDLSVLQLKLLKPRENPMIRIGQFVLPSGQIAAVIKKENTANKDSNIQLVVARTNVFMKVDNPDEMLDFITNESNSKQYVLLTDAVLFNRSSLLLAQQVLV